MKENTVTEEPVVFVTWTLPQIWLIVGLFKGFGDRRTLVEYFQTFALNCVNSYWCKSGYSKQHISISVLTVFTYTHSPAVTPEVRSLFRTCWRCCSGHWRRGHRFLPAHLSHAAWSFLWRCVRLCGCRSCTGHLFHWWWCSGQAGRTQWWVQGSRWPCRHTGPLPSPLCILTHPEALEHLLKKEIQWVEVTAVYNSVFGQRKNIKLLFQAMIKTQLAQRNHIKFRL